jgi:hypothetical protein
VHYARSPWERRRCHVGPQPPDTATVGELWFDTVELAAALLVRLPNGDERWLAVQPAAGWQVRGALAAVQPPFSLDGMEEGIGYVEAHYYAQWFGKDLSGGVAALARSALTREELESVLPSGTGLWDAAITQEGWFDAIVHTGDGAWTHEQLDEDHRADWLRCSTAARRTLDVAPPTWAWKPEVPLHPVRSRAPRSAPPDQHIAEHIATFGLRFTRPAWWEHRIDRHGERDTYVFWDKYTVTLRMTPWRQTRPDFDAERFLARLFEEEQARAPEWKHLGGRRFLAYTQDGVDQTRLHYYITGQDDVLLACSFAYPRELLDEEYAANEVAGALDDLAAVLASITFD